MIWLTFEQKQNLNSHATQRFQESFVSIIFMYKYELHSTGTASFQQAYKQRRCLNTSFKTLLTHFHNRRLVLYDIHVTSTGFYQKTGSGAGGDGVTGEQLRRKQESGCEESQESQE